MRHNTPLMTLLLICCVSAANAHELKTSISENNKTKELTSTAPASSNESALLTEASTQLKELNAPEQKELKALEKQAVESLNTANASTTAALNNATQSIKNSK